MQFKFIKEFRKKRYQNLTINNRQIDNLFKFKKKIITKFKNSKVKIKQFSKNNDKKNINTERFLKKYFENIYKKKNKNIYIELYKKFSVHLSLKEKYSKKLKKIGNKKTQFNSYIYLGFIFNQLGFLNKIQELNFLLKLNEKIILNYEKINDLNDKIIFSKNLEREFFLLKKYNK